MATDGEIDYRGYTRAQLDQVRERMDRQRYPLNYQHLLAEIARRDALSPAGAATVPGGNGAPNGPVRYAVEFNADPREYFRIWIVNLALTVATFGIYSAWAKVRKLRYFYSSTTLAGSAFGYHGEPLKILRGRIIAAAIAACYFVATRTSPRATLLVIALLVLATPWLVVKSRMFSLRVTSWRGLRFDFAPDYAGAYRTLVGWLILGVVTAGLLMPRLVRERYRFIVTRSRYGATAFECNPGIGRFYRTAFAGLGLAIGVTIAVMIPAGLIFGFVAAALHLSQNVIRQYSLLPVGLGYIFMFAVVHGYTQARNLNEVFSHTTLDAHRVVSRLEAGALIRIYLANTFLVILTLGLYTPWAQIRLTRYRLEALQLEAHGSLDDFVAASAAPVPAATGEELSSLLDVDFGF
jgi:uncharacterized membrane protein YjgN (DUF898 family)